MTKISWDESGSREYLAGVDRGVLYPDSGVGVPWNGLTSVTERDDSSVIESYVDGRKLRQKTEPGSFSASLQAFTYPNEFSEHEKFSLSYRTLIGNDIEGLEHGYKIHLVYNASVAPSSADYQTINEEISPMLFEWPIETEAITLSGVRPFSHLIVDSTIALPTTMAALEDILYGATGVDPSLPTPEELIDLFQDYSVLKITDHGDGSWTAEGPDSAISMLDATSFEITWPSAIFISSDSYKISSM